MPYWIIPMHEFSIATALIRQVLALADQHGLESIERVEIEVGTLQLIVPEALKTAFAALAEGTPAQGAVLEQKEIPLQARCRGCANIFEPAIDNFMCPLCSKADLKIIAGRDIILSSLSGPEKEKGDSS